MKVLGNPIYRIEDVEVDTSKGCLRREGQETYLRQKAFQVLVYLLEQRERLVTKEELMEVVWSETAVTDDALVQCVMDIRRALGDGSHHPHLIKTLPKVGYRFIGAVEELRPARLMQTEQVTSVELEYEEEVTGETRGDRDAETRRPFLLPRAPVSVRRRVRLVTSLAVIVVTAVGLAIYVKRDRLNSNRQLAALALPRVPGKKSLAVMYFENQAGSAELDWLREGLADMLISDLSRSKNLTVLSRQQLYALLERLEYKQGDKIRFEQALDIARRSHAEAIVLGSFAKLGEKIRIDVKLHDGSTGQLLAAENLIADKPDQVLTQVDLLSLKLATHLGAAPADQDKNAVLADVMTKSLEAYRYYSLGLEKAQAYHSTEAIALWEKAIALDRQFAMAYARIGYAYAVAAGLTDKAKPYLEKAFQLSDRLTEKDKLYIVGWYAIANLDYPTAIESFRELIAQYPLEVEAYHRLGRLFEGEDRLEEAVDVIKQGLVVDAEAKNLYNLLGGLYSDLGRHDDAIAMSQRYVALAPEEPNAHDSLGLSYQWAGRYDQAIEEYDRALALNPDFEIATVHLGNVYFQLGRYREAIAQYQRYTQIAPSNVERARGYSDIAQVYSAKQEPARAEEAAKKSVKYGKYPVWNSFIITLGRVDLQAAERMKEEFGRAHTTERGMRSSPVLLHYSLGFLALKTGRAAEAVESFKEVLRHRPLIWNIDSHEDCLANAYLELNQLDEAIAEYERLLKLNPNYPLGHYHLGQAYERKGQQDQARTEYLRFLEIWKDADADDPEVIAAKRAIGKAA